jgi:hypothetical protein
MAKTTSPYSVKSYALLTMVVLLAVAGTSTYGATTSSNSILGNSINSTNQQPFRAPAGAEQRIVVNINANQSSRTQAKTDIVSGAIVVIGFAGIAGGVNHNRRSKRKSSVKAKGQVS